MKKRKALVCDAISEEGVALLKTKFDVTVRPGLSEADIVKIVGPYSGLIVRSSTRVTARIIKAGKSLRIVGRAGIGVDNVDVEAATGAGVVVVNAPRANTLAAAEHTVAMLLALCRNIPQADRSLRGGEWNRKKFVGSEVLNKTLGVVGLGRIGSLVAERARGLGMKVIAYDPFVSEERARKLGIEIAPLDRVIREADFITAHVPKTEKTYHLIGAKEIRKMKPGVRIVNCSRGGIIDEAALAAGLKSGAVAGAALDVFEQEPPVKDNPLFSLPGVIATPHLGASTSEAQVTVALDIAKQFIDFFDGLPPAHAVNMPSIRPELISAHRPYFALAEKIGRLHASLLEDSVRDIHITYSGDFTGLETALISRFVLVGLLKTSNEAVNFVNAAVITKNRGINLTETTTDRKSKHADLLTVEVTGKEKSLEISGTLFNNQPRIVQINGYSLDLIPEGDVIIIRHKDRPGMIGKVGTLLGNHNINIAGMQVGRKKVRGDATMALAIDDPIPKAVLDELRRLPGLTTALLVKF